jgi:hypothetical protein
MRDDEYPWRRLWREERRTLILMAIVIGVGAIIKLI